MARPPSQGPRGVSTLSSSAVPKFRSFDIKDCAISHYPCRGIRSIWIPIPGRFMDSGGKFSDFCDM
jgi:hypothetical protein